MAKVNLIRCDRCGRVENAHFVVAVTHPDGATPRTDDLCDVCVEGLLRYLDGAKLQRPRKAREVAK